MLDRSAGEPPPRSRSRGVSFATESFHDGGLALGSSILFSTLSQLVLGVRPELGQPFSKADAVPGGPSVALISHDLWMSRFGGDQSKRDAVYAGVPDPLTATGPRPLSARQRGARVRDA